MSFITENIPEDPMPCDTQEQKDFCARLANLIKFQSQLVALDEQYNTRAEEIGRQFPGLKAIFRYTELLPDQMVAEITRESNDSSPNAFGVAPSSLSISADLTMPGINGLRVGELFWIDRIPSFYRAFGAFQIMSIEEIIDMGGWQTKIHARFNYLGREWRQRVLELFNSNTNVEGVEVE